MIWIPRSHSYHGEPTLFSATRILFILYTPSMTYLDLISTGMNISFHPDSLWDIHTEPEDRGSMFLHNVCINFHDHIILQRRTPPLE
jgi:hypothetical protein